jgi:hypothetical protein
MLIAFPACVKRISLRLYNTKKGATAWPPCIRSSSWSLLARATVAAAAAGQVAGGAGPVAAFALIGHILLISMVEGER